MCAQMLDRKTDLQSRGSAVAGLPRAPVLAQLSRADRALLTQWLSQPVDYVPDPTYSRPGAERELFGVKSEFPDRRIPRFYEPTSVVDSEFHNGEVVRLTTAQEQLAFKRYNYARYRCSRIIHRASGGKLTKSETWRLIAWAARSLDVRSQIVRLNMPLVLAMAKRTRLTNIDVNEMISEGNMALLRSVEKFDCGRGFKFSTYSCRAILKSFSRVAMKTSRYRHVFPTEFDPTVEQSDFLDRKREGVEIDCVDEIRHILLENSAGLTDVERTVIVERFSLNQPPSAEGESHRLKTLEQVGTIIGVTKERVRQIQNKALDKLKLALMEQYLAA
ncbi:MAG: sigma-70 family RNA polymerase sigma factor [Phycisphaerales bacterium]|nr:sigma-70 family RNA polymerase sigma factor [Phycisphaerales bacterium]